MSAIAGDAIFAIVDERFDNRLTLLFSDRDRKTVFARVKRTLGERGTPMCIYVVESRRELHAPRVDAIDPTSGTLLFISPFSATFPSHPLLSRTIT